MTSGEEGMIKMKKIILILILMISSISLFAVIMTLTMKSVVLGSDLKLDLISEAEDGSRAIDDLKIQFNDFSELNDDISVYSNVYKLIYSYNIPREESIFLQMNTYSDGLWPVDGSFDGEDAPIKVTFVDKKGSEIKSWKILKDTGGIVEDALYQDFRIKLNKNILGILPAGDYRGKVIFEMINV